MERGRRHTCRFATLLVLLCATVVAREEDAGLIDIQIETFLRDLGHEKPIDLVLVLDRSTGVGQQTFYLRIKNLCRAILQQYVALHVDFTRLAVVTFGGDVTLVIDYISQPVAGETGSKCHVMSDDVTSPWRKVVYIANKTQADGTNLVDSLELVDRLFERGRANRPNVSKQVLLLVTDGDYQSAEDPIRQVTRLKENALVVIYTVGCGAWLRPGQVRELSSQPEYYQHCRYAWRDLVQRDNLTSYAPRSRPLWMADDAAVCGGATCAQNAACQCDIWRGVAQCNCNAGHAGNGTDKCTACATNAYKESTGSEACDRCPPGTTTSKDGATTKGECACVAATCTDPCEPSPCAPGRVCRITATGQPVCECPRGLSGPDCSFNDPDCDATAAADCQNGGTCVDMVTAYVCVCAWGFLGRHCETQIDECAPGDMCRNNATCEDRTNDYFCRCPPGWRGKHCRDVDKSYSTTTTSTTTTTTTQTPTTTTTTTTTTPTPATTPTTTTTTTTTTPTTTTATTPPTTTAPLTTTTTTTTTVAPPTTTTNDITTAASGAPSASPDTDTTTQAPADLTTPVVAKQGVAERNRLLLIVGAAIGSAVVVILIVLLIAVVARRRHRRHKRQPPTPPAAANGDISHAFSGFWKKQTVRGGGGVWRDQADDTLGFPSVPTKRPKELPDDDDPLYETAHEVAEAMYTIPKIYETPTNVGGGMLVGWNSCLAELVVSGAILSGAIVKVDGEGHAASDNWDVDVDETRRLVALLTAGDADVPAHVQDGEYHIRSNDGATASGRTIGSAQAPKVIELRRTKDYVIVALADAETDEGTCRKEVEWIGDHISGEGY